MSNYLPYGFTYPAGFAFSETNPDPGIESIRERINFLNICHDEAFLPDGTPMPGHIFTAALDLFQASRAVDIDKFWDSIRTSLTYREVAQIAEALAPQVMDAKPYLDFPNTIALFDCRFISTKEWEHIRRYSIGGSEVGAILGVAHYQSPRSLYYEKKLPNLEPHSAGSQQIFDYGHAVEDHTIEQIASILGAERYPETRMFAHKKYPFLTCNPDAIFVFPDGHFCLFEAKTATQWKRDDWRNGIPEYYIPQPRHYLEVLNDPKLDDGYIGCCMGALVSNIKCYAYQRDKAAGTAQIQKCVEYWNEYIVPGKLPDFCGDPDLDMEAAYGYNKRPARSGTVALESSAQALFEEYFTIQDDLKQLNQKLLEAEAVEESFKSEIWPYTAEGITLCSNPNGLTYKIKVSYSSRESVNELAIPPDVRTWLYARAEALRDKSLEYTLPKVNRSVAKKTKKKVS